MVFAVNNQMKYFPVNNRNKDVLGAYRALCHSISDIVKARKRSVYGLFFGSPCWTRTNDTAVNSRMLYRLS